MNGDAGGSAEEETEPKQEQKTTETSTTLEVGQISKAFFHCLFGKLYYVFK